MSIFDPVVMIITLFVATILLVLLVIFTIENKSLHKELAAQEEHIKLLASSISEKSQAMAEQEDRIESLLERNYRNDLEYQDLKKYFRGAIDNNNLLRNELRKRDEHIRVLENYIEPSEEAFAYDAEVEQSLSLANDRP